MATSSVHDLVDTSTIKRDGTLGLTGRRIVGPRVVLEQCVRAITTRRGTARWASNQGVDIGELENADLSATDLERFRASLEAAIREVEFVAAVASTLRIDAERTAKFAASIVIVGAGTYPLAVSVDQAGRVLADLSEAEE